MSANCKIHRSSSYQEIRIPWYSQNHPMIPKFYVQPWREDIVNREIIMKNAQNGGLPTYEHDDALYLNNREQITYNVEDADRVNSKYKLPSRYEMLNPKMYESTQRYKSHLMARFYEGAPTKIINKYK